MAERAFQTDSPEPVEHHHHEFDVATQQTLTSAGRSGTVRHLEFRYGAAPDVKLSTEVIDASIAEMG